MKTRQNKGEIMPADENFAPRNAGGQTGGGAAGSSAADNLLGIHSRIGEQLRAFYTGIQEEAIPAHLLTLLEKLDEAENSSRISLPKAEGEPKAGKDKRHG